MIRFVAHRPAVAWAVSAALLIAGAIAVTRLPLAARTSVELPKLQIAAAWPGAAPETIETYLTSPLEVAVQGVRGVRRVESVSSDDFASLTIELDPAADVAMTRLAMLERIELLRPELPPGAYAPTVGNYVPEGLEESPLLSLTVNGPYTPGTLQELLEEQIRPRLNAVPGVAGVSVRGGTDLGVSLSYDAAALRRVGVSPEALASAVGGARIVQSLGVERRGTVSRGVVLRDGPASIGDLLALPVAGPSGRVFRLGELATVRSEEDARGRFFRIDGAPAVAVEITRAPGADAIRTAALVRRAIDALAPTLPPAVRLRVVSDASEELKRELRDLARRGAIAFVAVLLTLAVMLRRWRAVALVMGSTSVAVAATALTLYLLRVPANLLTLAGLGMGIGILVQNGLVVVGRFGTESNSADDRARAARRIMPAVVGSTLTTGVVLIPFLYLQGNARAAFMPFALAFGIALAWSVLTALLLLPALGHGTGAGPRTAQGTRSFAWRSVSRLYVRTLAMMLRWRATSLAATAFVLSALGWGFWTKVPRTSFGGFGERRTTLAVNLSFPRGSDHETLDRAMREFERLAVGRREVERTRVQGYGAGRAAMHVLFTRSGALTGAPIELQESLTGRAVLLGGASVSVSGEGPGFSSGGGAGSFSSFRIRILGYSYDGVSRIAGDLTARLERITRVRDVRVTSGGYFAAERGYQVTLSPDRAAMARFGISASAFAGAIAREVRGPVGRQLLEFGGDELPVTVKATGARDRSLGELSDALVPNALGAPVRVTDLAAVSEREALGTVVRDDQQYVRQLSYDFRGPAKLARRTHSAFVKSLAAPAGYGFVDVTDGDGDTEDDSDRGLWLVFAVGVALVALSVALVFDSVWAAVMVLLSLPVSLGGIAAAFLATGAPFTREAAVGVILVVGLAVSHAILLVDAALVRRRARHDDGGLSQGLDAASVLRATAERAGLLFFVTLAGLASLAPLSLGNSSGLFGAIALATAGGTVAGTVGALFVLPLLMVGRRRGRKPGNQWKARLRFRTPRAVATLPVS